MTKRLLGRVEEKPKQVITIPLTVAVGKQPQQQQQQKQQVNVTKGNLNMHAWRFDFQPERHRGRWAGKVQKRSRRGGQSWELLRLAARGRGVPSRCFCLKSL